MGTSFQVVMDCANPDVVSKFWAAALHYVVQPPPDGFDAWPDALRAWGVPEKLWDSRSAVIDPEGVGARVFFQKVPEPKTVKNRVHLDINIGGGPSTSHDERRSRIEAEVERLQRAGATVFRRVKEGREFWIVMKDPEGNEFCVQ
jgi:hypothetical protein